MTAAGMLRPPLRAATFGTLIGLLACTGLRIGEAIRLDSEDFDPTNRLLTIRDSKFGKSREVLLHTSTVHALVAYDDVRDRLCPRPKERSFFITTCGTRLCHPTIYQPFRALLDQAGVRHPSPPQGASASTISATPLLSRRCLTGTATAEMSRPGCRCCLRTWGTSTRLRRSGTCPPRRSCLSSRPSVWSRPQEDGDDRARSDARGVLHQPARQRERRQSAHDRRLS